MKLLDRLGGFSKTFLVTLALLLVVLQSTINYLAGPDFSFVLFYLLPISFVAWLVLTGATNRRSFFEAAQSEINRARRHRHPFTVAYIDVDNFKELNDRGGHAAGDALLREVTRAIKANVREIDMVARLGGDEFVVLLPETDEAASRAVVSRVRKCLDDLAARRGWQVTFSIGVVTWTTPPRTVDTMIRQADDTMYEVKNTGKNRVAHHTVSGEPAPASEPAGVR
ncbi:MAG: GGDEF domain-containing protein [Acidobacteria bacterium]|nr:GGDEF domain-containing protein [Acidobacteriota bacterium]